MSSSKEYGLLLPEKKNNQKPSFQALYNVFGNDSESEEEQNKAYLLQPSNTINRQTKSAVEKAIEEDPTVYQYDEVYDTMVSKKEEKKSSTKKEKNPKYIENLLKTAQKRKLENERRIERQIQKEREKEGEEFADKEVFVTSAYKKKLEEMKIEEEREKREEYLEKIGDITKQADLGGFYRHLYEQKLGSEKISNKEEHPIEKKNEEMEQKEMSKVNISKKRQYRKRKSSEKYLSEGEVEDSEDEVNRINLRSNSKNSKKDETNIDDDSDFLSDSDSVSDSKEDTIHKNDKIENVKIKSVQNPNIESEKEIICGEQDKAKEEKNILVEKTDVKPKIDIWQKRTTGEVFEQALKRYYARKAARGC